MVMAFETVRQAVQVLVMWESNDTNRVGRFSHEILGFLRTSHLTWTFPEYRHCEEAQRIYVCRQQLQLLQTVSN